MFFRDKMFERKGGEVMMTCCGTMEWEVPSRSLHTCHNPHNTDKRTSWNTNRCLCEVCGDTATRTADLFFPPHAERRVLLKGAACYMLSQKRASWKHTFNISGRKPGSFWNCWVRLEITSHLILSFAFVLHSWSEHYTNFTQFDYQLVQMYWSFL